MTSRPSTRRLAAAALLELFVFAVGASATAVLIVGFPALMFWIETNRFAVVQQLPLAFALCVPLAVGFWAAARVRRLFVDQQQGPGQSLFRGFGLVHLVRRWPLAKFALGLVLCGYFLTWAMGVPAVQSDIARSEAEWGRKADPAGESTVLVSGAEFGVPLLPGLVLLYHDHHGGRVCGWGGLKLYLWYGTGQRELFELPLWVT